MTTLSPLPRVFPPFEPTEAQRQGPAFAEPKPRTLEHALSEEQIAFFWENGYLALPGLFSPEEGRQFQVAADRVYHAPRVDPKNIRYDFARSGEGAEAAPVLWKLDPFFDLDDVFRKAVFDRRILDALASLYGGREPRLFKDKLICKPPHTHGNALHQDYNWWQGYPTSLISVCVSVDAATEANGCTVVYPRDPRKGFVGEPGTFNNQAALEADASVTPENAVRNHAVPGDVLLFHCFTPHEAGANTTDALRRQMFLTYSDSVDGEFYFSHNDHYRRYYLESKERAAGKPLDLYFL